MIVNIILTCITVSMLVFLAVDLVRTTRQYRRTMVELEANRVRLIEEYERRNRRWDYTPAAGPFKKLPLKGA